MKAPYDRDGRVTALNHANQMIFSLLLAADESDSLRAQHLLRAAKYLSGWLVSVSPENLTHKINCWRTRSLLNCIGSEKTHKIRQARRELPASGTIGSRLQEVCLAILLGDQGEPDFLIAALPQEDRARLATWPIWNLNGVWPKAN
jgi:hypothetical protein